MLLDIVYLSIVEVILPLRIHDYARHIPTLVYGYRIYVKSIFKAYVARHIEHRKTKKKR